MPSIAGIGRISGELFTYAEDGRVTCEPTVMCCHCGGSWIPKKGSGRRRGICLLCNGYTCGCPECDACVPMEQMLENIESGKPLDHRPIRAVGGFSPSDRISEGGVILGA